MLDNLLILYSEFNKWYGPTFHKREGRYYIYLYNLETKKRTTISYAKALMECKLNRKLNAGEEVDHIDNNNTNDDIINLQVLSKLENRLKCNSMELIEINCDNCGKLFSKAAYRIKQAYSNRLNPKFFCGSSCRSEHKSKAYSK